MTATLSLTRTHRARRVEPRHVSVDSPVNYAARRAVAVVVLLLAATLVAFVSLAAVGPLFAANDGRAAASDAAAAPVVRIHVAQPGDTLWSIAERYRGEVGHGRFVDALIDLNGGTAVQVGQAIRLP
jgi:Tfp pilus assembly protein FimV